MMINPYLALGGQNVVNAYPQSADSGYPDRNALISRKIVFRPRKGMTIRACCASEQLANARASFPPAASNKTMMPSTAAALAHGR